MKKLKLVEEVDYMLTDEAKKDKMLNPVDLNMLAILQYIKDGKANNKDMFSILIKQPKGKWDDEHTSIEKYFKEFGVQVDYTTLNRSINKLQRLGYLKYATGFYNKQTQSGQTPKIQILKGTIGLPTDDIKLTDDISDSYSVIAIAKEKEKEKNKEKENTKDNLTKVGSVDEYKPPY